MLDEIREAVVGGDEDAAAAAAGSALENGVDPSEVLKVLTEAIREVGEGFQRAEVFLPEMMLASDAMKAAVDVVRPAMLAQGGDMGSKGKVVVGTIQHDIHDIGKNIVATFLEISGFEVHDLGRDVAPKAFAEKAVEVQADLVAVSVLLTSTMTDVPLVWDEMKEAGLADRFFVVGGAPVTEQWTEAIGADGTAKDAVGAARLCEQLIEARAPLAGA